jgi:hypothetical protein
MTFRLSALGRKSQVLAQPIHTAWKQRTPACENFCA